MYITICFPFPFFLHVRILPAATLTFVQYSWYQEDGSNVAQVELQHQKASLTFPQKALMMSE